MMSNHFDGQFFRSIKYIQDVKLFNEIQNNKKILILDLRKKSEYEALHLDLSINIPYDEKDDEFFQKWNETKINLLIESFTNDQNVKLRLKNYKRYFIGIIISNEKIKRKSIEACEIDGVQINDRDRIIRSLLLYKALVINHVRELGLYNMGMEKLKENFGFLLHEFYKTPLAKDICGFPTDILDHRVYVGNQRDAASDDVLKYLKITHIINVTQHVNNKFEDCGITYLNIKIDDTDEFSISQFFKTAYDFIEEALNCDSKLTEISQETSEFIEQDLKNSFSNCTLSDSHAFTLKQSGVNSIKDWREAFNKTNDISDKNKIIQDVFKNHCYKKNSDKRILIHCSMGVSRSPTIAVMYMMKKFNLRLEDALKLMFFHREKAAPIDCFQDELKLFEENEFKFCNEIS